MRTKKYDTLSKAIFHVCAVFSLLQARELRNQCIRNQTRQEVKGQLTVKNAAGLCSSAQKRSGVSRIMLYGKFGDHN